MAWKRQLEGTDASTWMENELTIELEEDLDYRRLLKKVGTKTVLEYTLIAYDFVV